MSAVVIHLPKVAVDAVILRHETLAKDMKKLVVAAAEIAAQAAPGQFIQLKIKDGEPLLRRPISIAAVDAVAGTMDLIYRVVGKGTKALAELPAGAVVNCLGPLGHGFDLDCQSPLLVGGGMGIAPLIFLAESFAGKASILMGGRNKDEMFWPALYEGSVQKIHITTDDGSVGSKGFTVDVLPQLLATGKFDRVMVCGPEIMMKAAAKIAAEYKIPCQVSLEKHMACGLGACLSCTCAGSDGKRKKVCQDGPVFWAQEVF